MKKNIFIILFIFIIFNQNILAKELFEPEVPDDIGINISWKALKRYQNFINLIKEEDKDYSFILSKYKKNFKSKLYFKDNSLDSICFDPPFLIGYGNSKANKNISAIRFGIFNYYLNCNDLLL